MKSFIEKNNITAFFRYSEIYKPNNVVEFGWMPADIESFDFTKPVIYSYYSRTKFATKEDEEASKKVPRNIVLVEDYEKYIKALTGQTPKQFFDRWKNSHKDEFKMFWKSNFPNADDKQHMLIFNMSRLIVTGKKFICYSTGYKIINPEDEYEEQD